jgi:hypothetical protein
LARATEADHRRIQSREPADHAVGQLAAVVEDQINIRRGQLLADRG